MEFTVQKTKVSVSPLFFAVLTAFLLVDKNGIAGFAVFFSALHESAHFLALLCLKSAPRQIRISLFGIQLFLNEKMSTAEKCIVLMAGFTVNFLLAAVMFYVNEPLFGYINLMLGIITAMPAASSDGGSLLLLLLDELYPEKSEKIFNIVSSVLVTALSIIFVSVSFITENYFILIIVIYMVSMKINKKAAF